MALTKVQGNYIIANAGVVANSTGTWAPGAGIKSFCVLGPLASDVYPIFWTNTAITITEIVTIVTNTAASPGINTAFYSGTTLGTVVGTILDTTNTSNITTGLHTTSFTTAAIAANSWVWCNVNTVSSINTFAATIRLV